MPDFRTAGLLAAALAFSISSTGCLFQSKRPRLFVPPPVTAKPAPLPEPPVLEASVEIPFSAEPPDTANWPLPQFPPPPKPAPAPRPRPAVQPPKPEGPPLPQPPAPKITQVFPAEQLREYTREFDESMDRARRALEVLAKRNVPAGDQPEVDRIRTFLSQAEQARPSDLVTAARLARAADLLAKDLLDRLQ